MECRIITIRSQNLKQDRNEIKNVNEIGWGVRLSYIPAHASCFTNQGRDLSSNDPDLKGCAPLTGASSD